MREELYYPLFADELEANNENAIVVYSASGAMRALENRGLIDNEHFAEWIDDNVMPHSLMLRINAGTAKEFLGELYTDFVEEVFKTYFSEIEVWD